MLHCALLFFGSAFVASLFGFGAMATGPALIAKVLFIVFLIMAIIMFVLMDRSVAGGGSPETRGTASDRRKG